ncbi:hypothetical protein ACFQ07_31140, partial [Actinomadura adrarensis]
MRAEMKVQPRQELIEIWKSTMQAVVAEDGSWTWGGSYARNPISDAEQLLCLMYPASVIPLFKIDRPDETSEDVLEALRPLGDSLDIPARVTEIIIEYLETYTDETGAPTFSGGSYFASTVDSEDPTEAQQALDVVDAYSMSITLTLYTIGFARVLRGVVRGVDFLERLTRLETLASQRLTAAMVGLLRSFTVNVFSPESPEGRALIRSVNQSGGNPRQVAEDLLADLS